MINVSQNIGKYPTVTYYLYVCYLFAEGDYTRMNYAYNNVTKGTERIDLDLIAIDDNIVEADEVYYLTIVVLPTSHPRVTANEAKKTTKIIIYNDDGKQLHM